MQHKDKTPVVGHLTITETDTRTGDTKIVVDDRNLIVNSGVALIPRALNPKTTINNKLGVLRFGDDVGVGGTLVNPKPPTPEMAASDQSPVFTASIADMNYYSDATSIVVSISLDGADVVGDDEHVKYTSAAIYSDNGTLFSYKRFPFRVFSRWVRVDIKWTITTMTGEIGEGGEGGEGEECPLPPQLVGVVVDEDVGSVEVGDNIKIRGYERFDDNSLCIVPNGSKWTTNNSNIRISDGGTGAILVTGSTAGTSIITLQSGSYTDSRVVRVAERFVNRGVGIRIEEGNPEDLLVGSEFVVQLEYIEGDERTNVNKTATLTVSDNASIISRTTTGVTLKIIGTGQISVSAIVGEYTGEALVSVYVPLRATSILLNALGDTRFDVGETLTINGTVYFNDGSFRLVDINDRWIYDSQAIKFEEVGTVGNLRMIGKHRGDYSIRVFIDGVEGSLKYKIAKPITTIDVTTWPQSPLHVIPNVVTFGRVVGTESEGTIEDGDLYVDIDPFYLTTSSPNLVIEEEGGVKALQPADYNIIVNKDLLENVLLPVNAKVMTRDPLEIQVNTVSEDGDEMILPLSLTITNPTAEGVYIDHNDSVRYFFDSSDVVEIDVYEGDTLKLYGGAQNLVFDNITLTVTDWGHFQCSECSL